MEGLDSNKLMAKSRFDLSCVSVRFREDSILPIGIVPGPNHHQIWTPCIHLLLKPASFLQLESENVMMEAHRHTSD